MKTALKKLAAGALAAVFGCVLYAALIGIPLWLLWNWVVPPVFSLPEITFLQALGISVLCSILFKASSPVPT